MRARLLAVFALAAVLCGCSTAWSAPTGEPYSAIVTGTGGPCEWLYALTNDSPSADFSIWLLQIEVDNGTTVESASSPNGWTASLDVPSLIMWMTGSQYLPAGSSLLGFGAKFSAEPAYQCWTVMFRSEASQGEYPVAFGTVDVVAEPAGGLAVVTGLASIAAHLRKKRGRV